MNDPAGNTRESAFRRAGLPMILGLMLVGLLVFVAFFGPALAPLDPLEPHFIAKNRAGELEVPPFKPGQMPGFPLGSDFEGRDLLSRFLWAFRPTLTLTFLVATTRLVVGAVFGILEGWYDGVIRDVISTVRRIALGIPTIVLGIVVIYIFGFRFEAWIFIIALTLTGWANTAKIMSGHTRLVKNEAFIEAARALGARDGRILRKHVLPQARTLLIITWAFEMSATLLQLAELGFLGFYLGGAGVRLVPDPQSAGFIQELIAGKPELGQMLSAGWDNFFLVPWMSLMAGTSFFVAIFSFMMLGEGLKRGFAEVRARPVQLPQVRIAPLLEGLKTTASLKKGWQPSTALALIPMAIGMVCLLIIGCAIIWDRFAEPEAAEAEFPRAIVTATAAATRTQPPAPATDAPSPTATLASETVVDGIQVSDQMIYVPGGTFPMGSEAGGVQGPVHDVRLSPYYIDRAEVTNAQWAECVAAGVCSPPVSLNTFDGSPYFEVEKFASYPVIYIDWESANTYCQWRDARLPTEAEWEMAACWNPETGTKTIYPWSDDWDPARLNYCDASCLLVGYADPNYNDGWPQMAPVDSFPVGASSTGALNMSGNIAEWVADWFDPLYYSNSPAENPLGPEVGTLRVVRGGAWGITDSRLLTCSARSRFAPEAVSAGLGFRCARTAE